jgi:hypothetical protein
MKKLLVIGALCLSVSGFSKSIPTPFWYSLSEKILAGTHQLISDDLPKCTMKKKARTMQPTAHMPLKCEPKKEGGLLPTAIFKLLPDDLWNDED